MITIDRVIRVAIAVGLAGIVFGVISYTATGEKAEWLCLNGKVQVVSPTATNRYSDMSIIGEGIICAPEWKISGVYGPNIESWDGPIEFRDFQPQE